MPKYRNAHIDVVLDVRTKLEYWLGHISGARNISVDNLPEGMGKHPDITKQSRIMVYCASGARSAMAASALRAAGFRHVVDGGGMAEAKADFTE